MQLLNQNKETLLFDPVRHEWVKQTPEEIIRQKLLRIMIDELGFPLSLLAVEKELRQLPHLQLQPAKNFPKRRIDILAFAKGIQPLLLIECKAVPLTPQFARQVLGYNDFVRAPFVALANEEEILLGAFDAPSGHFSFSPGLQSYTQLISRRN